MEFTVKGGIDIRPNGYVGLKITLDCELADVLGQFSDKDILACLDADAVAGILGLVKPQ